MKKWIVFVAVSGLFAAAAHAEQLTPPVPAKTWAGVDAKGKQCWVKIVSFSRSAPTGGVIKTGNGDGNLLWNIKTTMVIQTSLVAGTFTLGSPSDSLFEMPLRQRTTWWSPDYKSSLNVDFYDTKGPYSVRYNFASKNFWGRTVQNMTSCSIRP